ncbi:hypothetical protein C2E23DRAFT_746290 [Lenzites betulinus]|nr:hypothetical protein C2E23DRAFT_746290 [Lenzites betulinus]
MARGNKKNRGRGGGGYSPEQPRGRGRGFQRGNGRGRGRGGPIYVALDDFDYPIQQWPSNEPPSIGGFRGGGNFRGRGRGRGGQYIPLATGANAYPTRGGFSSRGGGRGRGEETIQDSTSRAYRDVRASVSKLSTNAPLAKQLYQSNIYLKPIKFVRSVHTATLFTQEEDILKPLVEAAVEGDEKSHVPTADTVSRVFKLIPEKEPQHSIKEEELEEIDFADIGRLQAEVDAAAVANAGMEGTPTVTAQQEVSFFVDTTPTSITSGAHQHRIEVDQLQGALGEMDDDDDDVIVYVAPHPRPQRPAVVDREERTESIIPTLSTSILTGLSIGTTALSAHASLPELQYEAATNPRPPSVMLSMDTLFPEDAPLPSEFSPSQAAPDPADLPPPPSFGDVSFSFDQTPVKKQTRRVFQVGAPRSLLAHSRKPRRKALRGFGAYGAMHEEALLHEVDPRRDEQRRGDSDVNWGTSDSDDGVEEVSAGVGGMDIDEGISLSAMKSFVHGMGAEGSRHVTMDDIADTELMRQEDEYVPIRGPESADEEEREDGGAHGGPAASDEEEDEAESDHSSEDDEVEAILRAGEAELIGEDGDEDMPGQGSESAAMEGGSDAGEDEEESSDEEDTPKRGFQTRLERMRASGNSGKDKGKGKARATGSDDSSDEAMSVQMTWADEDEEYLHTIQNLLNENQHMLNAKGLKAQEELFAAIQNGQFDSDDEFADAMSPAKRGKNKDVPPELRAQWEKDRAKKAENKRKRALERLQLAADPLAPHKGGKKGQKAMLAAARADADADLPHRVVDFAALEQEIRRFLADPARTTMPLPPADKETRKRVHELATAFNLKSLSKGAGKARYTTLAKCPRSGLGISERKIRSILQQAQSGHWIAPDFRKGGGKPRESKAKGAKGDSKAASLAHHREGEVVGKEAPKIGASNIGFKMLATMGWSDGDRIGLSGGLDVPLTAIMKKTKLGLGASMQYS